MHDSIHSCNVAITTLQTANNKHGVMISDGAIYPELLENPI